MIDNYLAEQICEYLGLKCIPRSHRIQFYFVIGRLAIGGGWIWWSTYRIRPFALSHQGSSNVAVWFYKLGFGWKILK